MAIRSCGAARILLKALRISVFVQLLLGNGLGALVPHKIGQDEYFLQAGRKVLRLEPRIFVHAHSHYDPPFSLISKIIVVATSGMVIFGCVFPFFWRKKGNPDGSAPMDLNSKDSASFETNSIHESIKGNPMRHIPQSPMRQLPHGPRRNPPSSPRFSPYPNQPGPLNLSYNLTVKSTQLLNIFIHG